MAFKNPSQRKLKTVEENNLNLTPKTSSNRKYFFSPLNNPLNNYNGNMSSKSKQYKETTKLKNSDSNSKLNSSSAKSSNLSKNSSQSSANLINQTELGLREFIKYNDIKFKERVCKGPPDAFRWVAWMIAADLEQDRKEDFYYNLLDQTIDYKSDNQIKKDLNRTIPDENLFPVIMTRTSLYNVLRAYACCDKDVSYCQGMNFIAAFILVVSDFNEVDTLYMMIHLFMFNKSNFGIRGFFMNNFPLLNLYIYQFNHLFEKNFPELKKHFDVLEIPNELWITKWFQTLFTICLPIDLLIRLWDCIFVKGLDFLFNFSLCLIKVFEKDLIKFDDISDICQYFNNLNPYIYKNRSDSVILDVEKIINDSLILRIQKNLLNDLKLEYEGRSKIDLSFIKINYDFKSLYNSFYSNKVTSESLENNLLSSKSLEFKSKFINQTIDVNEEDSKKKNLDNLGYDTNYNVENDYIINIEDCSEFEEIQIDVLENVKMHTLETKSFESPQKIKVKDFNNINI